MLVHPQHFVKEFNIFSLTSRYFLFWILFVTIFNKTMSKATAGKPLLQHLIEWIYNDFSSNSTLIKIWQSHPMSFEQTRGKNVKQ